MIILTFISILGLASSIPLKHPNNKSIVKLPIEQHPSLRERLIRSGNLSEYKTWKNSQLFKNKKSAPLIDYADAEFLVKISQGTPAQTFKVIVDTGSSDYWLIDSSCISSACNGVNYVHRKFHSSRSSTFQNDGTSVEVDYETGTMQGYLAYDVVN
uniref:Peptidase A1 domain-containing protein n=1 Tax=Acrobeloides nanus TaxID=290746 RepID=A0A914D9B5_9BILA